MAKQTDVAWERLKAHELRALANDGAVVIIPIASIEQHGPHLPVMTDTRLGVEVAQRAARIAIGQRGRDIAGHGERIDREIVHYDDAACRR